MQLQWRQSSLSSPQPGRLETLFYWQWSRSLLINVRYFFSLETLWCVLLSHPFSTQSTQLSEILPISHGSQQCQFLADFSNICTGPGRLGEWGTKLVSSGYNIFLISKNNLVIIKYISVTYKSISQRPRSSLFRHYCLKREAASEAGGGSPVITPGNSDGGIPKGLGTIGEEANRIRSISDSCRRLVLALLFWNQILTCVSESLRLELNSARSEIERYCFSLYFFSRAFSCWVVKGVRGFLLALCFLSTHLRGAIPGLIPISRKWKMWSLSGVVIIVTLM